MEKRPFSKVFKKKAKDAKKTLRPKGSFGAGFFRKKACKLCLEKVQGLDYKDVARLQKFVTERGKISPSRLSGLCAKHQRALCRAIKKARHIALLPYTARY